MADSDELLQQIQQGMAAIMQQNQHLNRQVQDMQQRMAQPAAQPPPDFDNIARANQKLLSELAENPVRVLGDAVALAEQRAEAKFRTELQRTREEMALAQKQSQLEQRYLQDPDIAVQPHAFNYYLGQTDPQASLADRYAQAAAWTKNYVQQYHEGVVKLHESRKQQPQQGSVGALPFMAGGYNFAAPTQQAANQTEAWREAGKMFREMQAKKRGALRAA